MNRHIYTVGWRRRRWVGHKDAFLVSSFEQLPGNPQNSALHHIGPILVTRPSLAARGAASVVCELCAMSKHLGDLKTQRAEIKL